MNYKTREALITEILQVCAVSNTAGMGDIFFSLAFRTHAELISIASELNINTKTI